VESRRQHRRCAAGVRRCPILRQRFHLLFRRHRFARRGIFGLLIRREELNEEIASGNGSKANVKWNTILRDRPVLFLLVAVALFHLANAPLLPVTALYIKQLGGSSALTTFYRTFRTIGDGAGCLGYRQALRLMGSKANHGRRLSGFGPSASFPHAGTQPAHGGFPSGAGWHRRRHLQRGHRGVCGRPDARQGPVNSLLGLFATAQAIGGVVVLLSRGWSCNTSVST